MPLKFTHLCELFQHLENLENESRDTLILHHEKNRRYREIIEGWFRSFRRIIDPENTDRVALLSSLFPERRPDRVYWVQQAALLNVLSRSLGLGSTRLQLLRSWNPSSAKDLVSWVIPIVAPTDPGMPPSNLNVEDIDNSLDRLAGKCRFSAPHIRENWAEAIEQPVHSLLGPLIRRMPSQELKWFLRLILKNLEPVVLNEDFVLGQVHFLLPSLLKFQSTFSTAAKALEHPYFKIIPSQLPVTDQEAFLKAVPNGLLTPQVGVQVGRPDFVKARSLKHCLQLTENRKWSVQKKLDGEYCQVHIDLSKGNNSIQIFAKSGKDATKDRSSVHGWIRTSLKLGTPRCRFSEKCILEGELLVYDDSQNSITAFHKIRKHVTRSGCSLGTKNDSPPHSHERLVLLFYDVLLVDDEVTFSYPYDTRKEKLTDMITYFEGQPEKRCVIEALEVDVLDFATISRHQARSQLENLFAQAMARREEGLVLKPLNSPYIIPLSLGRRHYCIKLKIDTIPSFGDTVDLVVFGVKRDTRKPGFEDVKWNCFAIACIENKEEVQRFQTKPVLKPLGIIFRPNISKADMMQLSTVASNGLISIANMSELDYFRIAGSGPLLDVDMLLSHPIVVEVFGSGFDKPPGESYFMLRFPRIKKIHSDRSFKEVVTFDEIQNMAEAATDRPRDLAFEEDSWRLRIAEQNRLKRATYVTDHSPFSNRDTTPMMYFTSPKSLDSIPKQGRPLVRIDSCEFELNDGRDDTVSSAQSLTRNKSSQSTTPFSTGPDQLTSNTLLSHMSRSEVCKRPRGSSKKAGSPFNAPVGKKIKPLEDVSNLALPRQYRCLSRTSVGRPSQSSSAQVNELHDPYSGDSTGEEGSRRLGALTASTFPLKDKEGLQLPLFGSSTVYICPHLRTRSYVSEGLWALSPAHVTSDLSHWEREVLDLGPSSPVVGESQAFPDLQKVVFLEREHCGKAKKTVDMVKRLKLAPAEVVRFWDVALARLAKQLLDQGKLKTASEEANFAQTVAAFYIGKITWSCSIGRNIWHQEDDEVLKQQEARELIDQLL